MHCFNLQPAPTPPMGRVVWADNMKCLGIVMVCYSHAPGNYAPVTHYLMSFHMPLFFFLSGFLVKRNSLERPIREYAAYRATALIVPYIFWGTFLYCVWMLPYLLFHPDKDLFTPLVNMAYGISPEHCGPLWFLPCLFALHLIFWWLHRLRLADNIWTPCGIALLGLMINQTTPVRIPWGVDIACLAFPFYWAGHWLQNHNVQSNRGTTKHFALLLMMLGGVFGSVVSVCNNQAVGMLSGAIGSPILFYTGAFSGILTWFTISQFIRANAFCRWVSANSLVLFLVHRPFYKQMYSTVPSVLGVNVPLIPESSLGAIAWTVLGMAVCVPLVLLCEKWLPWAVGRKRPALDNHSIARC